jgi:hypothetical protein
MSGPFIFVSQSRVKEGKFDEFKRRNDELCELVESKEPRVIAFNVYASEDGTEVSGVQVHPDAESMEFHMQVLGEQIGHLVELLDTYALAIYGEPSDDLLTMMKQMKDVPVTIRPSHLAGFLRPQPL